MRIGILTFHWATNYGAVLQAYCLQEYLRSLGHDVEIVNYKPKQYDFTWLKTVKNVLKYKTIGKYINSYKKECLLTIFRNKYLSTTKRLYTVLELRSLQDDFDAFITGSDQVLNPSFVLYGENGKPSNAYYLGFTDKPVKKIGYAVSFGCVDLTDDVSKLVSPLLKSFEAIGAREKSGLDIIDNMKYNGLKEVVPDPTILYGKQLYSSLGVDIPLYKDNYTCVYMLRRAYKSVGPALYIDDNHNPLTLEGWMCKISHAKRLITNSYHGMVMAILAHVPFVVLLESGTYSGMNDRFVTLLNLLGLNDRLVSDINQVEERFNKEINFSLVDDRLEIFQSIGKEFLINNTTR